MPAMLGQRPKEQIDWPVLPGSNRWSSTASATGMEVDCARMAGSALGCVGAR
jgi:hypothetical protein